MTNCQKWKKLTAWINVTTKVDQNKIKINTGKNNVADSECDDARI